MAHTYTRNYIHLVFSTKERVQTIKKDIQPRLWGYMAGICRNHELVCREVGGLDDHVHLLFHLPARIALARAVYLIKTSSSKWMKDFVEDFEWQAGYGAFSVSASNVDPVIKYIRNQATYHKKISFQQEYVMLLKKHRVEFDPRYVFG